MMKKLLQISMLVMIGFSVKTFALSAGKFAAAKTASSNSAVMTYSVTNSTKSTLGLTFFPAVPAGSTSTPSALTGTSTLTTTSNAIMQVAAGMTSNVMVNGTPATFIAGPVNQKTGAIMNPVTTTIGANTAFTAAKQSGKLVITGSVAVAA